MPRYDHTLEDFYSMSLAAKPVLEAAFLNSTDEAQRKGLKLALLLVTVVREFAREIDGARARSEVDAIEKLGEQLVQACSPAPAHFRIGRLPTEVLVEPLVREAEEWLARRLPDAQPGRDGRYNFDFRTWSHLRYAIETAGLTMARYVARRRG
jgi:hypothetical protein